MSAAKKITKGENMRYAEWNEILRKIFNETPRLVSKLKLPNTVILKFRKGESKKLSIDTFLKTIEGMGLEVDVVIRDKEGSVINVDKLAEIASSLVENKDEKRKTQRTLATIAGVIAAETVEAETANETAASDAETKAVENANEESESSGEVTAAADEVEIDLNALFPTS